MFHRYDWFTGSCKPNISSVHSGHWIHVRFHQFHRVRFLTRAFVVKFTTIPRRCCGQTRRRRFRRPRLFFILARRIHLLSIAIPKEPHNFWIHLLLQFFPLLHRFFHAHGRQHSLRFRRHVFILVFRNRRRRRRRRRRAIRSPLLHHIRFVHVQNLLPAHLRASPGKLTQKFRIVIITITTAAFLRPMLRFRKTSRFAPIVSLRWRCWNHRRRVPLHNFQRRFFHHERCLNVVRVVVVVRSRFLLLLLLLLLFVVLDVRSFLFPQRFRRRRFLPLQKRSLFLEELFLRRRQRATETRRRVHLLFSLSLFLHATTGKRASACALRINVKSVRNCAAKSSLEE